MDSNHLTKKLPPLFSGLGWRASSTSNFAVVVLLQLYAIFGQPPSTL